MWLFVGWLERRRGRNREKEKKNEEEEEEETEGEIVLAEACLLLFDLSSTCG